VKRILNIVLSDLHIGNETDRKRTGGDSFMYKQARRRLGRVVREVCAYKRDHRAETGLVVWLLGDLGHGEIHRGGGRVSDQVSQQIALLGAAATRFRDAFGNRVAINCVTGNHGRFLAKHPERAADDKADSFETIVYRQLGTAGVAIPETPYVDGREFGWRILATHGDTMFKLPNPGRSINMATIEQKLNRWTASRWRPDVLLLGHHHTPTIQLMPAGNTVIINGALCPADEYALSIDIPSSPSAQVMFETTAKHAVGDIRIITLGADDDRDKSLDKVLP
jgi:hypothetical protein